MFRYYHLVICLIPYLLFTSYFTITENLLRSF